MEVRVKDLIDCQSTLQRKYFNYVLVKEQTNGVRYRFTVSLASPSMGAWMVYTFPDYRGYKKFKLGRLQENVCCHLSVYFLELSGEQSRYTHQPIDCKQLSGLEEGICR